MSLILVIQNDGTGTPEIGNYRVQVRINNTVLLETSFYNYPRVEGWSELLFGVVDQIEEELAAAKGPLET